MRKYEKYKVLDISCLGDIPDHWEINRIKNVGSVNGRVGWKALKASEYVDSGYFFLSTPNIKNTEIDYINVNYITKERYIESPEIMLKNNDILLVKDGSTLGIVNIVKKLPSEGTVNSSIAVLKFKKNISDYIYYLLTSQFVQNEIQLKKDGMGVPHLFQKDINNFILLLPPLQEQTVIAQYLDAKIQAIDKKIVLLTEKAKYYKELRKSIINDAVCKGLDKNVEMKESGIGFLVNCNWEIYRLKDLGFLYSGLSGKAGDDFNQENNPNNKSFIPFTNIANNTYLKKDHLGAVVVYDNEKQNKVKKGDIFFLMSSEGYEDIGKTAVLDEDINNTYLNSFCKGYRLTKKNCCSSFLNYLLLSANYRNILITEGKGFTRINLKMEKITDFIVYIPPTKEEQTEIANYLDAKTNTVDKILNNIQTQIETLKELRKTLINDVVTGKIKVIKD